MPLLSTVTAKRVRCAWITIRREWIRITCRRISRVSSQATTSGGAPYEIAVPESRADGELLNERHHLLFVDYLRLCFRFGGFPGFDGVDDVPPQIETLREGLLEF